MSVVTNIEDLRIIAQKKLPKAIYDYINIGAFDEVTRDANSRDFQALKFRQRVLVDVSNRSLGTTILGTPYDMPVAISPVGLSGILAGRGEGEIFAARAAKAANVPFGLSMLSIATIEDVQEATDRPFWFHVMPLKDRGVMMSLFARAAAAHCSALIVTVDWQVPSQRHNNLKNGLSFPPRMGPRYIGQYLAKPHWLWNTLTSKRPTVFGNFSGKHSVAARSVSLFGWLANQLDDSATWEYIAWIRQNWAGKIIVKGILDPRDAVAAVNAGVDAISVSNHGGTQLDGAPSTISVLPSIVDAVGGKTEIFLDGGIRSGQDVIKALALGAQTCLLGRAYLFGLAANGEAGVGTALSLIRNEMKITLGLTGIRSVGDVDGQIIYH